MQEFDILRAVLEHAPESLVIVDTECRIVAFNQGLSVLLEAYFQKKPAVGDDYTAFIPPEHLGKFNTTFQLALQGESTFFETPTQFNDETYWFENTLTPIQDSQGKITGVIFCSKNITQQTKYHQALEIQASTMQNLFDQASESMILLDLEGKIIRLNQFARESIQRLRQLSPEPGQLFKQFVDPSNIQTFERLFHMSLHGKSVEEEMSAISVDNQTYWFRTRLNPVYHAEGKLVGVTVISEYITEQKKVEIYLIESEARFRSILHAIPLPIVVLDKHCDIIGINPYTERIFRWKEQDVLGQSIDSLIPANFHEDLLMSTWESLLIHLMEPENSHEVLEVLLPPTSQTAYFEVYANDFEFRGKKQTVVMFLDITNHIQSSRVIQNQLEILREVAFVQSHVIRSPLAKILGITNLLLQENQITLEERSEWLGHLTESAEELDIVIQQLVDRIGK